LATNNPINASANLNVNGATFAVGAFNETVNTVTLTSGAISGTTGLLTSTNTFQVQSGTDSAILAGANGLTKTTGGTVTLSGANTYGGATTVNGGTLADGVANALPTGTALTVDTTPELSTLWASRSRSPVSRVPASSPTVGVPPPSR
jgi:autotransporter-associated beta strand protein